MTITYGSKAGGGAGATATATTGAQTWQLQQRSTAGGVFTNLGASPSITINAANGSGTLTASIANVSASQTGRTITFTYTAAAGGHGERRRDRHGTCRLERTVYDARRRRLRDRVDRDRLGGRANDHRQRRHARGRRDDDGRLRRHGRRRSRRHRGATTGAQTWQAQEKSTLAGVLVNLAASPSITVYAADGSGTATSSISVVSASQTGRTVTLTYTAATGGMLNGSLSVVVPTGWTPPATVAGPASRRPRSERCPCRARRSRSPA